MRGWCEMKYRIGLILLLILAFIQVLSFGGEVTTYELYVGQSLGLTAQLYEDGGDELPGDVKWFSSDANIATVKDGIITAKGKGFAIISYESISGASVHAGSVYINVKSTVFSVELIVPKTTMQIGETMTTDYVVTPVKRLEVPHVTDVKYSTSNSNILKVDSAGIVTAVGEGAAFVHVITEDGNRKDSIKIHVEKTISGVFIEKKH